MGGLQGEIGSTSTVEDQMQAIVDGFKGLDTALQVAIVAKLDSLIPTAQQGIAAHQNVSSVPLIAQMGAAGFMLRGSKKIVSNVVLGSTRRAQKITETEPDADADADAGDPLGIVAGTIEKVFSAVGEAVDSVAAPLIAETNKLKEEQAASAAAGGVDVSDVSLIPANLQNQFETWLQQATEYCQSHVETVTFCLTCWLLFYYVFYGFVICRPFLFFVFALVYGSWAWTRVMVAKVETLGDLEADLKVTFLTAFGTTQSWVIQTAQFVFAWFLVFAPFLKDSFYIVAPYGVLYGNAVKLWYLSLPQGQKVVAICAGIALLFALRMMSKWRANLRRLWDPSTYGNSRPYYRMAEAPAGICG